MADVFRLTKALVAVTLSPQGRASLINLPVDARLRITGQSSLAGLIDVTCDDKLYCLFRVDLIARSVTMRAVAAAEWTEPLAVFTTNTLGVLALRVPNLAIA